MSEAQPRALTGRSLVGLLGGMIVRPRRTLTLLTERGGRSWWLPALLASLFLVLPMAVGAPVRARLAREAFLESRQQIEEQMGQQMSQEQLDQTVAITASPLITLVFPAVGGVAGMAVTWLAYAGALYLGGLALGGRRAFGGMFGMVVWTWLPYAVRGLLRTVYTLSSGEIVVNEGLAGFVEGTGVGQILLKALLGRVDLFLIWHLALLIAGVGVVARLPRRKAVLLTLGVWLLMTLLGLLPALIGGVFARQMGGL